MDRKSSKKSHSTLRAKRATFTFWVDKSSFKSRNPQTAPSAPSYLRSSSTHTPWVQPSKLSSKSQSYLQGLKPPHPWVEATCKGVRKYICRDLMKNRKISHHKISKYDFLSLITLHWGLNVYHTADYFLLIRTKDSYFEHIVELAVLLTNLEEFEVRFSPNQSKNSNHKCHGKPRILYWT